MTLNEPEAARTAGIGHAWLPILRRYLALVLVLNLLWETGHLPLYSIWHTAPMRELAFAIVHCVAGDLLIATAALVLALVAGGTSSWPEDVRVYWRVGLIAIVLGAVYTLFSEWMNVEVRKTWTYSSAMPILPGTGTGLSPLAQWILVPMAAFCVARRKLISQARPGHGRAPAHPRREHE